MKLFVAAALAVLPLALPCAAQAQLLSEHVEDQQRQCIYVGTQELTSGEVVPRSTVVLASQPCPDTAPFRNPNMLAPGNAALLRETAGNGRRECVYGQGGVEYTRVIPATSECAMTPDLLDRLLANP